MVQVETARYIGLVAMYKLDVKQRGQKGKEMREVERKWCKVK